MNEAHSTPAGPEIDRETRRIARVAFYAFLLNLVLAGMKGGLAYFSNSLAVTAGAIDSATDAVASLVLFAGLKLSTKKTPSFPLGLYKIENMISVFVAFSIFFAGYEIVREILSGGAGQPTISMTVVALLLLSVVATFLFGRYALATGRRTGSPTLIAEGRHRQVDVLSSLVVLVAVLPGYFQWKTTLGGVSIDQVAAVVVLVFIARTGWELLADGMRVLLDASLDFETLDQVRTILKGHPLVVNVKSLVGRNAGRFRFLQADILVRTDDLQKAHRISETLEEDIRRRIPNVERVSIHFEPQRRTHARIAIPLADRSGKVSGHFGEAPWFALVTVRLADRSVEKEDILENPHKDVQTAKGLRVAEWLVGQKVDHVATREDFAKKGPGYVLSNAGVQFTLTTAENIRGVVKETLSKHRT